LARTTWTSKHTTGVAAATWMSRSFCTVRPGSDGDRDAAGAPSGSSGLARV
jgi:hypothetical protein